MTFCDRFYQMFVNCWVLQNELWRDTGYMHFSPGLKMILFRLTQTFYKIDSDTDYVSADLRFVFLSQNVPIIFTRNMPLWHTLHVCILQIHKLFSSWDLTFLCTCLIHLTYTNRYFLSFCNVLKIEIDFCCIKKQNNRYSELILSDYINKGQCTVNQLKQLEQCWAIRDLWIDNMEKIMLNFYSMKYRYMYVCTCTVMYMNIINCKVIILHILLYDRKKSISSLTKLLIFFKNGWSKISIKLLNLYVGHEGLATIGLEFRSGGLIISIVYVPRFEFLLLPL